MSQKELIKIIEEIYGHCKHPDGEQCSEKLADLILAGISKKLSFDKEKTAILNELVNGTGKK